MAVEIAGEGNDLTCNNIDEVASGSVGDGG
jgi:hypothetical protein